jgi:hypothetical protein
VNDAIRMLVGVGLMAAGMTAVGYSVYLAMIRAVPLRRWDRPVLLLPVGLVAVLSGLVLTR